MANTDRDLINATSGNDQDPNADDYQATAGRFSYAGLPSFFITYQGVPVARIGQPLTQGATNG